MRREREIEEILRKMELELGDLENSQPIHIAKKMRKHVLERMPRAWLYDRSINRLLMVPSVTSAQARKKDGLVSVEALLI